MKPYCKNMWTAYYETHLKCSANVILDFAGFKVLSNFQIFWFTITKENIWPEPDVAEKENKGITSLYETFQHKFIRLLF